MAQTIDLNSNQTSIISQAQNLIANTVNNYIVRATGGNPTSGINGFVFDIFADEEITLESEISDHYVEDNYAIQDHIAQKPIKFMLKGYVGELVNIFPNSLLSILTSIQSLDSIPVLGPVFSAQATQVYAQASAIGNQIGNVITQAKNIYSLITDASTTVTKQQNAYNTFFMLWYNRTLCTVETPFTILYGMAIERITPMQPENSQNISEFTVTFKQIRTVTTQTTSLTINNPAGAGSIVPAQLGLPVGNGTTNQTGLLDTSINNIQSNAKGRVSQMLNPISINGQTTGVNVTGQPLKTAFGLDLPI